MAQLYVDPQQVVTAEAIILTLQQGQHLVEDYTVELSKWSANTG